MEAMGCKIETKINVNICSDWLIKEEKLRMNQLPWFEDIEKWKEKNLKLEEKELKEWENHKRKTDRLKMLAVQTLKSINHVEDPNEWSSYYWQQIPLKTAL
jgi:hypothetical protein